MGADGRAKGKTMERDNLIYLGDCRTILGTKVLEPYGIADATDLAQFVEKNPNGKGNLVVKYNEKTDIHKFYRKEALKDERVNS